MRFLINRRYSFNTLAAPILGARIENVKVKAILTLDSALKLEDVVTTYNTAKTFISNLPDNPNDCTYIQFEKTRSLEEESTEHFILAYEYIDINTITEVNELNLLIDVFSVNTEDIAIISNRLKELGYTNFKIRVNNYV